ncbi:hypothetical protein IWQ57_005029, partial [Coemansia nantahalensis]
MRTTRAPAPRMATGPMVRMTSAPTTPTRGAFPAQPASPGAQRPHPLQRNNTVGPRPQMPPRRPMPAPANKSAAVPP